MTEASSSQETNPVPAEAGEKAQDSPTTAWFGAEAPVESGTTETNETTPPVVSEDPKSAGGSSEQGETQETKVDEGGERKFAKGFEKRIERFEKRLSEKDAIIERLLNQQPAPTSQTVTPSLPVTEPELSMFDGDVETYTKAHSAWAVQQAMSQFEQKTQFEKVVGTYQQREQAIKAANPDYDDVIKEFQEDYRHVNAPEINQYLVESDVGPDVYYFLATHRTETDRILALPPHKRLGELGKLEAKLSGNAQPKAPPKVSTAPKPVTPERGAAPRTVRIDDPSLTQAQYRELRMASRPRY